MSNISYRPDIDGLRALAVLLVIGFHAFGVRGGFVGVDIFFVISGYLISMILFGSLYKDNFSFVNFYIRRIKRILPALVLVLFTSILLGWFLLLPAEYKQLGKHLGGASAFISNFMLWRESGYFDADANTRPLLHLWSLGIEEQFYILWPLFLWGALKARCNLLLLTSMIAIASFSLNIAGIHSDAAATFYSPQTRFWELACGGILAWFCFTGDTVLLERQYIFPRRFPWIFSWRFPLKNLASFLGMSGIIFCATILSKQDHFPGFWAVIPALSATLIIVAGDQAWFNRNILSHRVLVWIGLVSFPLYLWHWPLLVFVYLTTDNHNISHHIIKILTVVISFLLAAATWHYIEKPVRFGQHDVIKALVLLVLTGLLGWSGYQIYAHQGFNQRVPKLLQAMAQGKHITPYPMASCFLSPGSRYTDFGDCGLTRTKNKKTILIWGDSHAAHLYAGYKAKYGDSVNFLIRTAASCPPILTSGKSHASACQAINKYVLQLARAEKPDKVVLSGVWTHYEDWIKVAEVIHQLKLAGIQDIDLIGPDPWWKDGLPRQLFLYSRLLMQHTQLPQRMRFGLRSWCFQLDKIMKTFAEKKQVHYISPTEILCNEQGCLTYLEDQSLVSDDTGHYTGEASIYLVSKFPGDYPLFNA